MQVAGGVIDFTQCLFQRFALLGNHQLAQKLFIFQHQFIPAMQDFRTRFRSGFAPFGECVTGRLYCSLRFRLSGFGDFGDHIAGCRIQHIKGFFGFKPFTTGKIAGLK
ncbi:hypothetical protein SRABI106_04586 [Rahnella aquatilis]|nr:hypothetical protein SRABI106_04586 [Rahnella aquatilis]